MTRVNMSYADRWIRLGLVVIAALLLYTRTLTGWMAVIAGLFSFVLVVSSLTGFCPLYMLFKINTARSYRKPGA